jgi:hypothetical protein
VNYEIWEYEVMMIYVHFVVGSEEEGEDLDDSVVVLDEDDDEDGMYREIVSILSF